MRMLSGYSSELGTRTASVPSLVYLCDDGSVLTGEAAERRGADDPSDLPAT